MADDLTPNDSAPEDMPETQHEPAGASAEAQAGETPAAEASAPQEPDTAVAVAEPEPEPIPDPTPAELALAEIREVTERVTEAWEKLLKARKASKDAKEAEKDAQSVWEVAVTDQQSTIKGQSEKYPLFDRAYFQAKNQIAETAKAIAAEKDKPADESWRKVRLDSLAIPSSTVKLLAESDIFTIGDVSNLQLKGLALTDVRGVGRAKADRIEEAIIKFWQENPKYTKPEPPKAEAKAEPEPDDEPREDRELTFEPAADEFDLQSDSQTSEDDEEGAPEPDEEDLEGDDQHADD